MSKAVSVSERSNAGSSSKRKRGDNEIIDDKTWTSGNFEVITSDRVRFRVQDYLLFASSAVFADMHTMSKGEKTIELDDTSKVFAAFLKFVQSGSVDIDRKPSGLRELARFMKKWDCPAAVTNLTRAVSSYFNDHRIEAAAFLNFADTMEDKSLFHQAIESKRTWPPTTDKLEGRKDRFIVDAGSWPLEMWSTMDNPIYFFALSRSFDESKYEEDSDSDSEYESASITTTYEYSPSYMILSFDKYLRVAKSKGLKNE